MHPLRPKLADAVATELRGAIASGRWRTWLPQERLLATELRVSRSTLRQALDKLKHERVVTPERSRGHRIVSARAGGKRAARGAAAAPLRVNLLMPDNLAKVRSPAALWIDDLRAQLAREGGLLQVLESSACVAPRPAKILRRLADQHPASCWILRMSGRATQEWFEGAGLPCVVVGTCHEGVRLPSVDIDHRAVSRHAVGRIAALGHRHIGLLLPAAAKAGDLETERGFAEGIAALREPGVPTVIRHDDGAPAVARAVRRLLRLAAPPTAILATHPANYLAAFCALTAAGRRVPEDVALVCCTEDRFMDDLLPEPARYRINPQEFASRALRCIRSFVAGSPVDSQRQWILPDFVAGASLGPPAGTGAARVRAAS